MKKDTYTSRFIFVFLGILLLVGLLISFTSDRNTELLGEWEEVEWKYEKSPQRKKKDLTEEEKNTITENMVIHEAEQWNFLPNGTVVLYKKGSSKKVMEWTLKGRGNILKLHQDDKSEHYNLHKIGDDELVLYFHTDLQAKGIVRLKFQRIDRKEYAEKI